ncbi:hypothetical protein BDA96_08G159300 [Sorghum bicolor]|uniref:Basic proline-rich protein-like n=1 Tax=Sorghum bicolor TaxID=4558 RepID=A0A921U7P8_SORBI|nr:hypothetical protein BDA96_08G159300 [Sorghum bicolor]
MSSESLQGGGPGRHVETLPALLCCLVFVLGRTAGLPRAPATGPRVRRTSSCTALLPPRCLGRVRVGSQSPKPKFTGRRREKKKNPGPLRPPARPPPPPPRPPPHFRSGARAGDRERRAAPAGDPTENRRASPPILKSRFGGLLSPLLRSPAPPHLSSSAAAAALATFNRLDLLPHFPDTTDLSRPKP